MIGDLLRRGLPRGVKDYVGALVHPPARYEVDFTADEIALCRDVEPYTMTGSEAVDEFFAARGLVPLLTRIDSKARLIVKEPPNCHTATEITTHD